MLTSTQVPRTTALSFPIDMKKALALEDLLVTAGMDPDSDVAKFFWENSGRSLDTPTRAWGIQIEFLPWIPGDVPEMRNSIVQGRLKATTFYEVLAFAAQHPEEFKRLLESGGVIVPSDWHEPYLVIRLESGGAVTLTEIDRDDRLELPLFYAGVYLR